MTGLSLGSSDLSGFLPAAFSQFINLTTVDFSGNNIGGGLPPQWSTLTSLQSLDLRNNVLTGQLPSKWSTMFSYNLSVDNRRKLVEVNVSDLYPSLPDRIDVRLTFDGNNIAGTLPASWSVMTSLQRLTGSNNQLTGTLPGAWSALASLTTIDLSNNGLTGTLPDWTSLNNTLEFMFFQVSNLKVLV